MATAFNTQTGSGEYRLQFETDNMDHFLLMQATARQCIDGKPQTHADCIRAMNDEKLADWISRTQVSNVAEAFEVIGYAWKQPDNLKDGVKKECLEWLRQPAEVSGDD